MTDAEYLVTMTKARELAKADPHPASPEGIALNIMTKAIGAHEMVMFERLRQQTSGNVARELES